MEKQKVLIKEVRNQIKMVLVFSTLILFTVYISSCNNDQVGIAKYPLSKDGKIDTRSSNLDTVFIYGNSGYTITHPNSSDTHIDFTGSWKWRDNNGGTTFYSLSTNGSADITCSCYHCGCDDLFNQKCEYDTNTGTPKKIKCKTVGDCDECELTIVLDGVTTIPNGITIMPN